VGQIGDPISKFPMIFQLLDINFLLERGLRADSEEVDKVDVNSPLKQLQLHLHRDLRLKLIQWKPLRGGRIFCMRGKIATPKLVEGIGMPNSRASVGAKSTCKIF
jgi:hypothetical protein